MRADQEQFLRQIVPLAVQSQHASGIPASITVAQAVTESAAKRGDAWIWGASPLFAVCNNPFGIKRSEFVDAHGASGSCLCQGARLGFSLNRPDPYRVFARFPSLDAAFQAHAAIFTKSSRYKPALSFLNDPERFARCIQICGYSTNPKYADVLMQIVKQFSLDDPAVLEAWQQPIVTDPEICL